MQKIMFNEKYGLQRAAIAGTKSMTRRMISNYFPTEGIELIGITGIGAEFRIGENYEPVFVRLQYKVGEVVAIAQPYKDIEEFNPKSYEDVMLSDGVICEASHPYSNLMRSGGWDNKLFVNADLMPHRIRIIDLKIERLQDISDEDCLKEGVFQWGDPFHEDRVEDFGFVGATKHYDTPREAFAALIDKVSGRGTWERNPWVFAYSYKLVK